MKKTIAISLSSVLLALPTLALARTIPVAQGTVDCESGIFTNDVTLATSSASESQLVGCVAANGNPLNVMQPWGLNMGDSMIYHVPSGATVTDEAGISFSCPATTGVFGCIKLVSLNYWKMQARTIATQTNGYGKYKYWLTH